MRGRGRGRGSQETPIRVSKLFHVISTHQIVETTVANASTPTQSKVEVRRILKKHFAKLKLIFFQDEHDRSPLTDAELRVSLGHGARPEWIIPRGAPNYSGQPLQGPLQMSQCLIFLDEPLAVADVLKKLSNGNDAPIPITKVQQNDETYVLSRGHENLHGV